MKIRLVKETDSFGRESWFCQSEDHNGVRFISGSVTTSNEADALAKFDGFVKHYGASKTEIVREQDVS